MNNFESYLFGLILTDGSVYLNTRNRGRITIELQKSDIKLLQNIQEQIPESFITTRVHNTNFKENYESAIWVNYHKEFRDKFFEYGIPKTNKSIVGTVPCSPYSQSDFWRGIFDGNGSIGFTKRGEPFISLVTMSSNLKEALCNLLFDKFNIHKNINRNKRDNAYNITLKNEDAIVFSKFLYEDATIYLHRKYEMFLHIQNWKRTTKKSKEQSWSKDEVDFIRIHSVEESMIHLHRSDKSIKMKLWRIRQDEKMRDSA